MKTTFTSLLLAFFCFLNKSIACDCLPVPDFCQTITYENNSEIHAWINIYHVKVVAEAADGITVSVLQNYHGEDITGQDIFLMDGNGGDCQLIGTYYFDVGDEAIIASSKYDSTWHVSECGITFLRVINGQVTGAFSPGVNEMPLENFQSGLMGCSNLNPTNGPLHEFAISVAPTLAHDQVYLYATGAAANFEVIVFDASGRWVHQAAFSKDDTLSERQVSIGDWNAGVYFFKINIAGREEVFKVVKMD